MEIKTDVVIVGTGVGGAFSALNLPEDKQILMIMRGILKIQCVQVITRTGKNQWIL